MSRIIVVTSGKGGTGKTTVAVNLGAQLAQKGKRTLIIDGDLGLRNADISLGMQDSIVYDFLDVLDGYCKLEDAIVCVPNIESLYLLPAPQSRNTDHAEGKLKEIVDRVKEKYDYVLIDCPAGLEQGFKNAISSADEAIIVTQCTTASVRDADRTISIIEKYGIEDSLLIINCVHPERIKKKVELNLDDIVDILGIMLLGVIPEDEALLGPLPHTIGSGAEAFCNIAKRIEGESVPIAIKQKTKKENDIFKFFKRRKKN